MSDSDDNFNLTPHIDEPLNDYKVVHCHNKNKTYHLMRQVLLDSVISQNHQCFFYDILAINTDSFNKKYCSFACLIERSTFEADLYFNVHVNAFDLIIEYVQTGHLEEYDESMIDLASMFGMPTLVSKLRLISEHPDFDNYQAKNFSGLFRMNIDRIDRKSNSINDIIQSLC